MKESVKEIELTVKHTPWQNLKNFYRKRRTFLMILLPLLLLTIFAAYVQFNLLNTKGKAESTETIYSTSVSLKPGLVVSNAVFLRTSLLDGTVGLSGAGFNGVSIVNIRGDTLDKLMKVGSGSQASNMTVNGMITRNTNNPLFSANLSDSTFENLDFQVLFSPFGTTNHSIYLERGNHNLTFRNVKISGGAGYGIHMYAYEYQSQPSTDILFDGLEINVTNRSPILMSTGYERVAIKNFKATGPSSHPIIYLYGAPKDVVIDGFEAWGGSSFLGITKSETPVNITLRNGIYHGTKIVSDAARAQIQGLTIENVVLDSSGSGTPMPFLTPMPSTNPTILPQVTVVPTVTPTPKLTNTPTPKPTLTPTRIPTPTSSCGPCIAYSPAIGFCTNGTIVTPGVDNCGCSLPPVCKVFTPTPYLTIAPTIVVPTIPPTISMTYEAESASIYGSTVANNHSGFTGNGFVDYLHRYNDYIEWQINTPIAGNYYLRFKYANRWRTRLLQLKVNGVVSSSPLTFPSTKGWDRWNYSVQQVTLPAGLNTIRTSAMGYSGPNIDHLLITNY